MKTGFFHHRIYTGPAVTGTDKMPGFHIDPADTLPDLSLEKIIVGNIFPRFIITHIQMIEPDKRFHCLAAEILESRSFPTTVETAGVTSGRIIMRPATEP